MSTVLHFLGIASSLVLSFVSSGMETALYRASRVRLRVRADRGEARAKSVLGVLDRIDAIVTTILVNNNIAAYAGTYFLSLQLSAWRVPQPELVTTAVITPVFFVLTESLPKQMAFSHADRFCLELVRVFGVLQRILSPVVRVLNVLSALLRRVFGSAGRDGLAQSQRALLMEHFRAGVAENVLTEQQNRMAERIMLLEGMSAGDSMIPLTRIMMLPGNWSRGRAMREMARRETRLALLTDGMGRPTGQVVTATGLLMRGGGNEDAVEGIGERLERIRDGVAIPEVLNVFRRHHARQALVVRGARIVGLITTRSVLDRIAGIA